MNKTKQKVTIALACGYKNVGSPGFADPNWKSWEEPTGKLVASPPDYLHDLNAMHEAMSAIPEDDQDLFDGKLTCIVADQTGMEGNLSFRVNNATAAQRAEAFLKTLGLWEAGD